MFSLYSNRYILKGEEYIAIRIAFFLITLSLLISIDLNADELVIDVPTNIGNTDVSITEFGGSSTIITEDDIESSGATEIYQLLRTVPGLSVKRSGARGGMISIFARGSESDHNLVLIDGVRANDIGGGFNFEFLSLNNIEMIEILRGPQSALYGSGAMGSVISITTKKPGAKTNASFKSAIGFNQGPKKKCAAAENRTRLLISVSSWKITNFFVWRKPRGAAPGDGARRR
ncbi:MAG TPA: TonB-dependent receptor [Candidatus Dadabacteria bacterium]|nr:TonB-dependent receptor [Candidatus Dadabacteria bacterium]